MARSRKRKEENVEQFIENPNIEDMIEEKKVEVKMKKQASRPVSKLKKPSGLAKLDNFDQWWLKVQRKNDFKPALKEALAIHFKRKGYMDSKKFDEGLKDFGY